MYTLNVRCKAGAKQQDQRQARERLGAPDSSPREANQIRGASSTMAASGCNPRTLVAAHRGSPDVSALQEKREARGRAHSKIHVQGDI